MLQGVRRATNILRSRPATSSSNPPSRLSRAQMATIPDWERVNPSASPSFLVFQKPLRKSPQDDRDYKVIRLENGLEAILVHDAKADKAAASLDVAVGHLHDPDDMPGLAHFCEHLLFMGTEEFPRENEYSEFLAKNNGHSNAFTSTTNTNYHFTVATPALGGALARFAGFFHSPRFAPSCTTRELNAVDSEHKKNHQADMWRIFQLSKHLSVDGHPWRKFGSGHRESLTDAARRLKAKGHLETQQNGHLAPSPIPSRLSSPAPSVASTDSSEAEADGGAIGRETRRRLMEWWSKEYCASRMRLCIVGSQSLDELAILASNLFSPIPRHAADPLPMVTASPVGPKELGTLVGVQTIMTFHALEISFPIEWQAPFWRHKPMSFISHFVGHEGPGSIHSYLNHKGWITALSCAPQTLARGLTAFKVTVYLTLDGFKHHRDIALVVFKFFSLLRQSQFDAFHQQELATLASTKFRFKEKGRPDSYATWAAENMTRPVPLDLMLSAQSLTWDWDGDDLPGGGGETKVREYLETLRPQNARITLMAKGAELTQLVPNAVWQKEPWYGTEYFVEKFDDAFIEQAQGPNDIKELYLPGPNKFIPTNVEVDKREVAEPLKRPHLIRETPLSILWHKKDDKFWVPKAHVVIDLRSPYGNESPRAAIMTRLYSDVVIDALTEFTYDASLAMLEFHFIPHTNGLYVGMVGYNDKMSVFVKAVLEKIKGIRINPDRLAVMKEQAKRDLENFFLGQSYSLSDYYGRYILAQKQWTMEELLKELPSVMANDLQQHVSKLLSEAHMRILVTGNIYEEEAIKIAGMAEEGIGSSNLTPSELNDRALILPRASNHTWTSTIPNPNQANSALTYYLHFGSITDQHLRVTSSLLIQILQEPAFNVLRTQEQLGYIVSCSSWLLSGQSEKGLRIVVQSEKSPGYLEDRVEAFLDSMKTTIEEMSPEEFEEHKESLKKRWLEAEKNLSEEASRFALHVTNGQWDFLRSEKDAAFIKDVTKEDVSRLFLADVHPASSTRAKLSVHMRSQKRPQLRISSAAAEAFVELVRQQNIPEETWKDAPSGGENPLLADFEKYWKGVLGGSVDGQSLLGELPGLVTQHPVPGEGEDLPRKGVTYITDLDAFKKGLRVSVDPGPMERWETARI
ncbi:Metalloenzyme, LuxS/M16 peptidase-like protein [Roridomyces roridus]|uniref:Metalloenzyme, LuxS/M16 peptidase-like protein n=1 Tax=Roridomyces roridus TaxID=1738132 RepID=A0AAD7BX84_9AGAR|nr:Metalloenzyme, LuxS/M16 peptidase-like protein [Roridomyces roridus]